MAQKPMDEPINDGDRQRYIDWLKAEIELGDSYHNHKETMAWAATAFYLPTVVGLAYGANRFGLNLASQIGLTVVLLFLWLMLFRFLHMQFTMRWKAADVAVGLRRALARVCDCTTTLSKKALGLDSSEGWELEELKGWPLLMRCEVEQEYKKNETKRTWGKIALAPFCWRNTDPRLLSESPTYYATMFATVLGLVLIWIDC
jgi:hypothetical protein